MMGVLLLALTAQAGSGVPRLLPYQGMLTDAANVPVNVPVTVSFRILPPAGNCYIYEDTQLVTPNNFGVFSVLLGIAGNSTGPANDFIDVFNNDVPAALPNSCATTYTPATNDWRRIQIVIDGVPMPQIQTVGASAFAFNAEMLEGRTSDGFIQVNGPITQANVLTLVNGSDASSRHHHDSLYMRRDGTTSATGNMTTSGSLLATGSTSRIGVGTGTANADIDILKNSPTLRLGATGVGATSRIDFFSGTTTQRASIQSSQSSDTLTFFTGLTEALRLDGDQNAFFGGSVVVEGTVGVGRYSNAQETPLLAYLVGQGAAAAGTVWINSDTGNLRYWNGASAQNLVTGSGAVSSVTAGTGLSNSGTASAPILNVQYGTAAGTAVQGNATFGGDVSGTYNALTVTRLQGVNVQNAAPADGQVLSYNAAQTRWEPTNSGLRTLNGLSAATQSFAVDNNGSTVQINSSGSTHTLSVPLAANPGVAAGLISKTQYDNFAAKQDALGYNPVNRAGDTMTGNLRLGNAQLRFGDTDDSNYVGFRAPAVVGSDLIWTLPATDGSAGQFLQTNGAGVLTFAAPPAAPVSSVFGRTGAVVSEAGDYNAGQITNTPAGGIAAANVQAAINELDTEKVPSTRSITTSAAGGLSGGGTLSGDLSLAINIPGVTALGAAADNADSVLIYDQSGGVMRRALRSEIVLNESEVDAYVANNGYALDSAKVNRAGDSMTGALQMNAQNQLRLADSDSSNYVGLRAPATVGANYVFTLPDTPGLAGQILETDGTGVLTWRSLAAVGETNVGENLGAGAQLYSGKSGVNLQFRTLSALNNKVSVGVSGNLVEVGVNEANFATSSIPNTPAGAVAATNVQAAINELDTEKVAKAGDTMTGNLQLANTRELRLGDGDNSNYVGFVAPAVVGTSLVWELPAADAASGRVLATDGSGALYWLDPSSASLVSSVYGRTGAVVATAGDYNAGLITNTPAGSIAATNVQTALNELDTEKVDTGRLVTAGAGLTGGGDLSANRTFDVGAGAGIAVAADTVSVDIPGTTVLGGAIAAGDELLVYDASGAALRKVTRSNFVLSESEVDAFVSNNGYALDTAKVNRAGDTMTGQLTMTSSIQMNAQNQLRLADSDSSNYVAFRAPAVVGANVVWELPATDGLSGRVLATNGSGALYWLDPSSTSLVSSVYGRTGAVVATAGDYNAGLITNTPAGNIAAVTVQAAINELDTEKAAAGVTMTAGAGLTGGGDLSTSRTFDIGAGAGISVAADTVSVDITGATVLGGAIAAGDELLIYDASTTSLRKVTRSNFVLSESEVDAFVSNNGYAATTAVVAKAGDTMTGNLTLANTSELRLGDADNSAFVGFVAPATVGSSIIWELPDVDGSSGQVLSTNGAGVLSWVSPPSAPVSSVYGRTGAVVATAGDYNAGQVTNTPAGNIGAVTVQAAVNELDTEKVGTGRQVTAGAGLTGGGDLSSDRTLNIGAGAGIAVAADSVSVDINGATVLGDAIAAGDELLIYDASAAALRKVARSNFVLSESEVDTFVSNNGFAAATAVVAKSGDTMTGALQMNAQNQLRLADSDSSNYVGLRAPATVGTNYVFTLPDTPGASGQVLETDGTGVLSWRTLSAVGETNVGENLGAGAGLYSGKSGVNLQFRSLAALNTKVSVGVNGNLVEIGVNEANFATSSIPNTPAGAIAATNVQGAINELDTEKVAKAGDTMTGHLQLANTRELRLGDGDNSNYVGFVAPATVGTSLVWQLPAADAASGRVLATDGAGALYWLDPATSAPVSSVFGRAGAVVAAGGDYNAGQITNTPAGNIAAVTVQAALNELDTEKAAAGITLTAGAGLTGGGDLSANRTFDIGAGSGISVAADTVSVDINGATVLGGAIAAGDELLIYDASATALRKVTRSNFVLSESEVDAFVSNNGYAAATAVVAKAGDTMTGALQMNAQTEVRFADSDSSNYVALRAPATVGSNYTWTLPATAGTAGHVLSTDGAGVLSWVAQSAGGEVNTASNIGSGGVAVYDSKSGVDLRFRSINAGSNKVTITLDGPNNEVDINVNEANFATASIPNTPAGSIAATNVQAALNELDTEKLALTGGTLTGAVVTTNSIQMNAQNEVRFADADSSNYVALRAPAAVGANYTWTLPDSAGLNGQVLATNGSGTLSWVNQTAAAPVASVFGRTGTVTAQANDYTWAQIDKTTSSLADITTRSAGDLTSGTLADARLSANIPRLNAANTFTAAQTLPANGLNVGAGQLNVTGGNVSMSGNLTVTGDVTATAFYYTSDARLKHDVRRNAGLDLIMALRGVNFRWNATMKDDIGFIAQEVEAVAPELVHTDPRTGQKAVKYGNITAPLVEATKEIHQMCQQQGERLNQLERTVSSLKEENESLRKEIEEIKRLLQRR